MNDRLMLAYAVGLILAFFIAFLVWRIRYQSPAQVRQRRYRRERALDDARQESGRERKQS